MKITISNSGGLRTTHLASLLDARGHLHELFTTHFSRKYPQISRIFFKRYLHDQVIDIDRVHTNYNVVVANKILNELKAARFGIDKWYLISEMTDKSVARRIRAGADILFCESNLALHTMRRARALGMTTVLDRTNSHILYQKELLEEEYASLGVDFSYHTDAIVHKGVQEYEEADYIAVLSTFVKNTFLARKVPENKLLLIPSAVSLEHFRQVPKTDDVFRLVFCGLSTIKKGTKYLLEAFTELNLKNAEICIIGQVHDDVRPLFDKYAGSYRWVGLVPYRKLYEYYSQGSVFVLPSLEEGMAKVTMEAMACGLPVIASENTGAGDIVREGVDGFVIPIRNKKILKEKISYLYTNPGICKEMGQNAKERVKIGFTWEDYTGRIMTAFTRIQHDRMERDPR